MRMMGIILGAFAAIGWAAPDPNFHIYLAFGQSNMEGQGIISPTDRNVDSRLRHLPAVSCANLNKTKGVWTTAIPPLARCYTGLSPLDGFGKTMVAGLPSNVQVGLVMVAVAGCKIELFDKANYQSYVATAPDWMRNAINEYGGNPYGRLVELGLQAKQAGVIKGILLHQGESNTGDAQWPNKVKTIYNNLLADLGLNAADVPLLVGQVVDAAQNGQCASMNSIINSLPQTIPTAHVISSAGCTDTTDNLHFNAAGYRELGKRYAEKMLSLLPKVPVTLPREISVWAEAECAVVGDDWEIPQDAAASQGHFVRVPTGKNSLSSAPANASGALVFSFSVDTAGVYQVYGRLNCPTGDDDSFWSKMDGGNYTSVNQLTTSGWQWKLLRTDTLSAGSHHLTIAYREDGAMLDKILITNTGSVPTGMGNAAPTCDVPVATRDGAGISRLGEIRRGDAYAEVSFILGTESEVSLEIYSVLGQRELAWKKRLSAGAHRAILPAGVHILKMRLGGSEWVRLVR